MVIKISHRPDHSYAAWCPSLPGCCVRAETKEAAEEKIRTAISGYLASLDVALPRELERRFMVEEAPHGHAGEAA